ncbi:MAG: hypothetical protein ChlgKO_03980 [Chlamydiales bacterium]
MRCVIFVLFTFVSVFATDYSDVRKEYISVERELLKEQGEAELLENHYQACCKELEKKLEKTSERFTKLKKELIRLRNSSAIGYEFEQKQRRYKEKKEAMIPIRHQLSHLRKEGEAKLKEYEIAIAEKRVRIEQLQERRQNLETSVTKSVEEAKVEMIAAKRELLSAIKSRKKNLDAYQNAYQKSMERYKACVEGVKPHL